VSKAQYRICTDSDWTRGYGFAFLAITNPSGSGKRLTLRSLEVFLNSCIGATAGAIPATLYSCAGALTGEDMALCAAKANSTTTIPAGIVVRRNAIAASYTAKLKRLSLARQGGAVGNQNRTLFGCPMTVGDPYYGGAAYRSALYYHATVLEPITVNNGESLALVVDQTVLTQTNPMRVNVMLAVNGHTVTYDFVSVTYPGGGNVVKVLSFGVMDVGTTDTPTLRVVPVGSLYAGDIDDAGRQRVNIVKMNSTYPDLSSTACRLYTDIPIMPQGVPEVAIAPASAGTPQGMNYLHTRDFWGPMYRNMLVECSHMKGGAIPDTFGYSYGHKRSDLFGRRAGFTINQGEGIAIVSSAETAVGVQPAWGGWPALSFAAQLDVEDITSTLTIAAPVSLVGAEIRIYDLDITPPDLGTELAGVESHTSPTYPFTSTAGNAVWIQIMLAGYEEFGQQVTMPAADATFTALLKKDTNA
jgi:hypothetical protein